jgi:hypothetical protein
MEKLNRIISSNTYLAFGVALAFGFLLSFIHDATQKLLIPVAEWARVNFIVESNNYLISEITVNFLYQLISFCAASLCLLLAIYKTHIIRNRLLLATIFISCLAIQYWWVLSGIAFGFEDALIPILPFIPFTIIAAALAFYLALCIALRSLTPYK